MDVQSSPLPDVFTRAEALAHGITPGQLRGPAYLRLFRNVYTRAETKRSASLHILAALRLAPPGSVIAGSSAARIWGGIVPDDPQICLRIPTSRLRVAGVRAMRGIDVGIQVTASGMRITTPEQTFLDLSVQLPLVDLVVLGDSLVRRGRTTPARLVAAAAVAPAPFRQHARRAASLVRERVDSPRETRVRVLLVLAGLPEPEVDVRVYDDCGRLVRRHDMAYRKHRIAIEYDGRQHFDDIGQWEHDIARREGADGEQWRFIVVTASAMVRPEQLLSRVVRVCRERGMPVSVTSDEWRRHFA